MRYHELTPDSTSPGPLNVRSRTQLSTLSTFSWGGAIAIALTATWLSQVRDFGPAPQFHTPAELFYGLNIQSLRPWQFLSYSLVHSFGIHIWGNLIFLGLGSKVIESTTDRGTLPLAFFVSGLVGAILQVLFGPLFYNVTASVGASGAIVGVVCLASVIALTPSSSLTTRDRVFTLLGLSAQLADDVYGALQLGFLSQIHLGGYLSGLCFGLYLRKPENAAKWSSLGNKLGYLILCMSAVITISILMHWI